MGKIIQLDEALSNMIAAGEVVENPASVVKELTENALDAESDQIDIQLTDYGLKSIKIIDNGQGMDKDDLLMAFKRHATSKIKTHHDLYHIASLGFRGEALPSIASVSEMVIESSDGTTTARKLTLKNGHVIEDTLGTVKQGTIITVKNLFYNTPARLKHLKSEQRELAYIVDYVNKMALSHPEVRFTISHNKKTLFKTHGDGDILKILHHIYGSEIAKEMLEFEGKNSYFNIRGFACKPAFTRSTRQHMSLICNQRMIKNNRVLTAILDGYRTYLPVQKYPIVYLSVQVDPLLIDINIHPQKLEIKFTEEHSLLTLIKNTIETRLRDAYLVPKVKKEDKAEPNQTKMRFSNTPAEEKKHTYEVEPVDLSSEEPTDALNPLPKDHRRLPEMEYIGQYAGTYLLFQGDEGLYLVDQHAAAERIRYERYYEAMRQDDFTRKPLLVPIQVHLSNEENIGYQSIKDTLHDFGLKTRLTSSNEVVIESVPSWFYEGEEEAYAETMIRKLLNDDDLSIGVMIDQLSKDLACKHSIKANKYITRDEVHTLMRDLEQQNNPYTCPHGRPTLIHFTEHEIERLFKRIQS